MTRAPHLELTRRERQVLEAVISLGRATVSQITEQLAGAVTYDAVRSALRLLRAKGLVTYEHDGKRYVYRSALPQRQAQQGALRHLVQTFFQGSRTSTMTALLQLNDRDLSEEDLDKLDELIQNAKRNARKR